jgi:hypothetical protein
MRPRGQKFLNFLDEFVEKECKHSVGRSKRKYQILLDVITSLKAAEERGEFPMNDHRIRTLMAEAKVHVLPEADKELFHGKECISLMDALKLQRHKTSDKNGHSKTPKSAAKLMHFIDPESMRQHAVEFLEKLFVKLNKSWPYRERAEDIRWIETYINGLKRTTHSTIEGLCMFKMKECEHNLLQTLSIVGPSRWKAKPYKDFHQWFELDSLAIKKKKPVVEVEEMHPVDATSTPMSDFN